MRIRRIARILRAVNRFIEFRVLHIDDSPERIAGGVFAGILIAYTPLLGLHLLIGLAAAMVFRINKVATLSFVWISNVFTLIPIYYPSYLLGRKILNIFEKEPSMNQNELMRCLQVILREVDLNSLIDIEFWQSLQYLFTRIGLELFIGGIIIGSIVAAIAYRFTARIITRHRKRKGRKSEV